MGSQASRPAGAGEPLYHPWLSHRLAAYLSAREAEATAQQNNADVAEATTARGARGRAGSGTTSAEAPRSERHSLVYTREDPFEIVVDATAAAAPLPPPDQDPDSLGFDSAFESGNLKQAVRVFHRGYDTSSAPAHVLLARRKRPRGGNGSPRPTNDAAAGLPSVVLPSEVQQEYDLLCKPDTYTTGCIQWYFFSVALPPHLPAGLRVRFNLRNMMKPSSLYNFGMRPCVFSTRALEKDGVG